MSKNVSYHRIYDEASPEDGTRVLVDRVWPRGMGKEDAHLDEWMRDIAPSTELRHWYGHVPERYKEFRRRYLAELRDATHQQAFTHLDELARQGPVTAHRHPRYRTQPGSGPRGTPFPWWARKSLTRQRPNRGIFAARGTRCRRNGDSAARTSAAEWGAGHRHRRRVRHWGRRGSRPAVPPRS